MLLSFHLCINQIDLIIHCPFSDIVEEFYQQFLAKGFNKLAPCKYSTRLYKTFQTAFLSSLRIQVVSSMYIQRLNRVNISPWHRYPKLPFFQSLLESPRLEPLILHHILTTWPFRTSPSKYLLDIEIVRFTKFPRVFIGQN